MTAAPDDAALPWLAEPAHAIATRQRGHALLIQGHPGAGVFELALRVARIWLCETAGADAPCGRCTACHLMASNSHPDFRALLPELTQVELGWSVGGGDAPLVNDATQVVVLFHLAFNVVVGTTSPTNLPSSTTAVQITALCIGEL